eukprot:1162128-Pelagomonas_calceolata.AAC.11
MQEGKTKCKEFYWNVANGSANNMLTCRVRSKKCAQQSRTKVRSKTGAQQTEVKFAWCTAYSLAGCVPARLAQTPHRPAGFPDPVRWWRMWLAGCWCLGGSCARRQSTANSLADDSNLSYASFCAVLIQEHGWQSWQGCPPRTHTQQQDLIPFLVAICHPYAGAMVLSQGKI